MPNSIFINSTIKNSIFTDSNLTKSVFKNTKIKDTNFTHSNLKGANFSSAKLFNVNLRDAVYDKDTLWPQKFNPSNFGAIEDNNYNPFDYKTKLSYQAIKNLPLNIISKYKNKKKKKLKLIQV